MSKRAIENASEDERPPPVAPETFDFPPVLPEDLDAIIEHCPHIAGPPSTPPDNDDDGNDDDEEEDEEEDAESDE